MREREGERKRVREEQSHRSCFFWTCRCDVAFGRAPIWGAFYRALCVPLRARAQQETRALNALCLSYRCARGASRRRGWAARRWRCPPQPEETGAAIANLRSAGEVARGRRQGERRDADRRGGEGGQGEALTPQRVGRGLLCRHLILRGKETKVKRNREHQKRRKQLSLFSHLFFSFLCSHLFPPPSLSSRRRHRRRLECCSERSKRLRPKAGRRRTRSCARESIASRTSSTTTLDH